MKIIKILVLGSNGFIGNYTANYFHELGHEVLGCDLIEGEKNKYKFHKLKIANYNVEEIFSSNQFYFCINAAGNGDVNKSIVAPTDDFESNVVFTLKILEAIRKSDSSCKYLHISSAAVYGNPTKLPISETDSLKPISPYGWHKLLSEQICKEYFELYSIHSAIIRPFSVYGPRLRKQIMWDVFEKTKNNENKLELWGTGEETRDFVFIDDLIKSIELILLHSPMHADVYNIGSGEMSCISDVVKILLEILEKKNEIYFNGITRIGNPLKWQSDISKIKNIGFIPSVNLYRGIQSLAIWLKSQ